MLIYIQFLITETVILYRRNVYTDYIYVFTWIKLPTPNTVLIKDVNYSRSQNRKSIFF